MFIHVDVQCSLHVCQVLMENANVLSQKMEKAVAKLESDRQ